ncbi:PrsW family intramembrane metalloprotease [Gordonia desulfuricans]|uniref:PrsW family intramembrane metalloprotease n=3 Tax=Gordonia TaxID=2053 RepID=A0A7K3LIY9_9ACTN|nr:PrsW family intramembrane metalloprotease [Gordonia desulfuricans]
MSTNQQSPMPGRDGAHHPGPRPYRPRKWYDWAFLIAAALGLLFFGIGEMTDIVDDPGAGGVALIAALIEIAIFALIVRFLMPVDRFPRTRIDIVSAVIWGGLIAAGIAGNLNSLGTGTLIAPFSEELTKVVGVLVVLGYSAIVVTPAGGFVIGFVIGASFEVVENIGYITGADTNGGDAVSTALARTWIGFALHPMWVAVTGAALAYALTQRSTRGWLAFAGAVIGAVILHGVWDNVAIPVVLALVYVVIVVTVVVVGFRVRRGPAAPATLLRRPVLDT